MSRGNEPLGEIASKVLFENDRVKIWNLTAEYEDGTTECNEYELGQWGYQDQHQVHQVINHTGRRYKNVLIELKD